jgi:D-ribose pyranase
MLQTGILNPHLLSLLARVRHTNRIVIADRGFPFWPQLETIDLSLTSDIPTVLQVVAAIRPNFMIARAWMASEFASHNSPDTQARFTAALAGLCVDFEAHVDLKQRVPGAIGLIRTADSILYSNIILESG